MRLPFPYLKILSCGFLLAASLTVQAQVSPVEVTADNSTGVKPFNSYGGVRENIALSNGNLNLQIPLISLPGRNGHNLDLALIYDSKIWQLEAMVLGADTIYWWDYERNGPVVGGMGWRLNIPHITSMVSQDPNFWACVTNFVVTLPSGSKHAFRNRAGAGCQAKVFVTDSNDGSFLLLDTFNESDIVLRLKNGTRIHFGWFEGNASKIVDANGNVITISPTIDTLGREVTNSASAITYKDSNGDTQTISLAFSSVHIAPTFSKPVDSPGLNIDVLDFTPRDLNLLSEVTLANGTTYSLTYNEFGELTKITYPTGGYTRYDFQRFTHSWNSGAPLAIDADFREVTARRVCREASGACGTEDVTTYSPWISGEDNNGTDIVDPEGTRTNVVFSAGTSVWDVFGFKIYSIRETSRTIYSSGGTLLRTVQTDFNELNPSGGPQPWSLPIRVTTTLNDTNQVSKVEMDYDTYTANVVNFQWIQESFTRPINISEQREYDYGNGTPGLLVRKAVNTWLKGTYRSTNIYILDRKTSAVIEDGQANVVAQTDFEYDNYTEGLTASNAVQHESSFDTNYTTRGNVTALKRWRNTDGAWLTTRHQYDDAGNILKSTDPLLHVTNFSYADSWANATCAPSGAGAAYLTSVTNHLFQVTSSTYNSCTGTVASTTDPNSQTTDFSYDLMGRLVLTVLPDGGQATIAYNEVATPFSATTTTKLDVSQNRVSTVEVDGLGRVVQSSLDSDPEGTIFTDTTYDAVDRKKTVTNPYRSTSEMTFGITTFEYDALGRVAKVIPPDGTSSSNNVTSTYSGNTTTVTDQQGKQRRSVTDVLGRLIQVAEPGGGGQPATAGTGNATVSGSEQSTQVETAAATPGTGSATVSGSEQSKQVQTAAATPGTGSATVSGSEQSTQVETQAATPGTGSATVSGSEQSKQVETAAATPGTGSATVSGSEQSTQVETDPGAPGTGSVTISGSLLCDEGGLGPTPQVPEGECDSGKVTIIVNGRAAEALYSSSQNWTANGIAAALRTAINNDPLMPVTASGGTTITLTAKTNGADTNYTLSTSVQALFLPASYTATRSGPTLIGGIDPTFQTVYDSGTVWVEVDGVRATASYGQGDTASGIAADLRAQLNAFTFLIASGTGTTIDLTASATGAGTNYTLTVGQTYDTVNFASPSFTAGRSGTTLTGGADAVFTTIYDSGTVWVEVNGWRATANYGQGSTASSIASDLRGILNGASSPVTAGGTGGTISLTSKATGAGSNYTLTVGQTYDTAEFSSASFTASRSGTTLTGGANAVFTTVYDSGTVWVEVDGVRATASYGQGDTASGIAADLRAQLNAFAFLIASGTGTTIDLTASDTGAGTNYTLTVGQTYDTANFASPSFTGSRSGTTLTGGADAVFTTIYDSGTVWVEVNGWRATANYGQGSTASSIASDLRGILNGASSPVTAGGTGGTISLTSKATGAGSNYTLTVGQTYDTAEFSSASFTASRSGATLTGGADAVFTTIYDSGTVWVTVDTFPATASYGQGSSASSIASDLRALLNGASSPVTAGGTGATITLTSKVTGPAGNYSLAVGQTYDTVNFASASFSASRSGATLTGGADAVPPGELLTNYTYDALDNLTFVDQGTRDRTFTYNSLSQLLSATNPEPGNVSYNYDNDGNLTSKTDARAITTSYTYDQLHRLLTKTYSDGTDAVSYSYDQTRSGGFTIANGKGRRTKMSDAAGSEIWSFDALGRVVTSKRKTSNKTKIFTYDYHLDGSLKFILYPSGRQVDYEPSPAGRLITAKDVANGINYVTGTCPGGGACYAPQGALSSLKTGVTGSFAGYSRTWSYNERLQPKDIVATAPAPTGDIFSLNYQFDLGLANNGNVMQITNNLNSARTQSFSYDELNRIQTAGVPSDWGLSYAYDRYGNMFDKTVTLGGGPTELHVTVDSKNQFITSGFDYDAAGNMTLTPSVSGSLVYDAENRMTSAAGVAYTYDGDGRRVKKSNGTLYWYGVGGEVLLETNSGGNNPKEFVFFNGTRVARRDPSGSVFYYFEDHLGSSRIIVQDGQNLPCYEADFYPFGGERVITDTCPQPYKFTGKERDSESGLDYFGARHYASTLGRFLQVDPSGRSIRLSNPQSWNRYAYTYNNPLRFLDPNGEAPHEIVGALININVSLSNFGRPLFASDVIARETRNSMATIRTAFATLDAAGGGVSGFGAFRILTGHPYVGLGIAVLGHLATYGLTAVTGFTPEGAQDLFDRAVLTLQISSQLDSLLGSLTPEELAEFGDNQLRTALTDTNYIDSLGFLNLAQQDTLDKIVQRILEEQRGRREEEERKKKEEEEEDDDK